MSIALGNVNQSNLLANAQVLDAMETAITTDVAANAGVTADNVHLAFQPSGGVIATVTPPAPFTTSTAIDLGAAIATGIAAVPGVGAFSTPAIEVEPPIVVPPAPTVLTFTVGGLNPTELAANVSLHAALIEAITANVAGQAGVTPDQVQVTIHPDGTVVATITPNAGTAVTTVDPTGLGAAIATSVSAIPGISSVIDNPVAVTDPAVAPTSAVFATTLTNVDAAALLAKPSLAGEVEAAIAAGVAGDLGVPVGNVTVTIKPDGTVVVSVAGTETIDTTGLSTTIGTSVASVSGISSVVNPHVLVTNTTVSPTAAVFTTTLTGVDVGALTADPTLLATTEAAIAAGVAGQLGVPVDTVQVTIQHNGTVSTTVTGVSTVDPTGLGAVVAASVGSTSGISSIATGGTVQVADPTAISTAAVITTTLTGVDVAALTADPALLAATEAAIAAGVAAGVPGELGVPVDQVTVTIQPDGTVVTSVTGVATVVTTGLGPVIATSVGSTIGITAVTRGTVSVADPTTSPTAAVITTALTGVDVGALTSDPTLLAATEAAIAAGVATDLGVPVDQVTVTIQPDGTVITSVTGLDPVVTTGIGAVIASSVEGTSGISAVTTGGTVQVVDPTASTTAGVATTTLTGVDAAALTADPALLAETEQAIAAGVAAELDVPVDNVSVTIQPDGTVVTSVIGVDPVSATGLGAVIATSVGSTSGIAGVTNGTVSADDPTDSPTAAVITTALTGVDVGALTSDPALLATTEPAIAAGVASDLGVLVGSVSVTIQQDGTVVATIIGVDSVPTTGLGAVIATSVEGTSGIIAVSTGTSGTVQVADPSPAVFTTTLTGVDAAALTANPTLLAATDTAIATGVAGQLGVPVDDITVTIAPDGTVAISVAGTSTLDPTGLGAVIATSAASTTGITAVTTGGVVQAVDPAASQNAAVIATILTGVDVGALTGDPALLAGTEDAIAAGVAAISEFQSIRSRSQYSQMELWLQVSLAWIQLTLQALAL